MHRADTGRALAHRGRHALGRARADVAHGEQPGMTRLEGERHPAQRRPALVEVLGPKGPVGQDEALVVEGGAATDPSRGRVGPDEGEESGTWHLYRPVGARHLHGPQVGVPDQAGDLRPRPHRDGGVRVDAVRQVAGHALAEVVAADDDGDRAGIGQEHGRLAGRIPPADDHGGRGGTLAALHFGRRVVDAVALERLETIDGEAPVARAAGHNDGPRRHVGAVGEAENEVTGLLTQ